MEKAQQSAGWLQELRMEAEGGGHTPETEEYGISSVVFREAGRPFHPARLHECFRGFGRLDVTAAGHNGTAAAAVLDVIDYGVPCMSVVCV